MVKEGDGNNIIPFKSKNQFGNFNILAENTDGEFPFGLEAIKIESELESMRAEALLDLISSGIFGMTDVFRRRLVNFVGEGSGTQTSEISLRRFKRAQRESSENDSTSK